MSTVFIHPFHYKSLQTITYEPLLDEFHVFMITNDKLQNIAII